MESKGLEALTGHHGPVRDIAFHPYQESMVCTASDDRTARRWDCTKLVAVRTLSQHLGPVTSVRMLGTRGSASAHDGCLATASADGHVRLWDLRAPSLICALPAATRRRLKLDVHTHTQLLLAASDVGVVSAWDLRTRRRLLCLDLADMGDVECELASIALSPCGGHLALGTAEGRVHCLDLQQQRPHEEQQPPAQAFPAPGPAPRRLPNAVAMRGGWLDSGPQHGDAVFGLAWGEVCPWSAQPAPFLACASHDGTWTCWEQAPGAEAPPDVHVKEPLQSGTARDWLDGTSDTASVRH